MPVPLSLDTASGILHFGNQSLLADVLMHDLLTPPAVELDESSCLLIDRLVTALELTNPQTFAFGKYAKIFADVVFSIGATHQRIDVPFDRYRTESIEAETKTKRKKYHRPVGRQI